MSISERTNDVLRVRQLRLSIPTFEGMAYILNGVDLTIKEREVLGLVGETGSGKTMTALTVTGLINSPPAQITAAEISYQGEDLLQKSGDELREIRAKNIAMVFQDPTTNLNPILPVGEQIINAAMCRNGYGSALALSSFGRIFPNVRRQRREAKDISLRMLERVGIYDAEKRLKSYPHEFSGGMKQRALIAMALAGKPQLLIADEPTTALDISIEAQIIELVRELVDDLNLSVLWVTHNLSVVWRLCTSVAVMYAGAVVERSSTKQLFANPQHPYTKGLLAALPKGQKRDSRLTAVPGTPPSPVHLPQGCRFHPRCPVAEAICQEVEPDLEQIEPGHWAACHLVKAGSSGN